MSDHLTMLERLDLETKIFHGPADAPRVALLGTPTRARYADHLAKIYAFEAPAEHEWMRTPGLEHYIAIAPRLFAPRLAGDLAMLGRFPDMFPTPPFRGIAHAIGWMYVVERGRLMSSMLHRHLVRRLPYESSVAGSYLAASGSLGLRWQQLGMVLDDIARTPTMIAQVVDGAFEAFRAQRHAAPPVALSRAS